MVMNTDRLVVGPVFPTMYRCQDGFGRAWYVVKVHDNASRAWPKPESAEAVAIERLPKGKNQPKEVWILQFQSQAALDNWMSADCHFTGEHMVMHANAGYRYLIVHDFTDGDGLIHLKAMR